ncbi:hypothetical protein MKW92_034558 [Papaver armeniacum]|nr:hypothetical protein MKW92_034558 [Papaver armeniacum]
MSTNFSLYVQELRLYCQCEFTLFYATMYSTYGLKFPEPNVTFALCCGTRSSPSLLLRNMADFAVDMESLVEWVCQQLPASGSLRKLMVDCIRGHNNGKIHIVENMPYDFEFQYLLSV